MTPFLKKYFTDMLLFLGAASIVAGIAMIYIPAAVIVAGLFLIAFALLIEKGKAYDAPVEKPGK